MTGDVTISGAGAWLVVIVSSAVLLTIVTIAIVSLVVVPRNRRFRFGVKRNARWLVPA